MKWHSTHPPLNIFFRRLQKNFRLHFYSHILQHIIESEGGGNTAGLQQEVQQLRNQLRQVSQEKNLLEFKNELLLDMVLSLYLFVTHNY